MSTDAGILEALDFTEYACRCPQHRNGCPNRATHIVHIHAVDFCNQPGLAFGNRVELRCAACTLGLQADIAHKLRRLNQFGPVQCWGCGAPIAKISDVLRQIQELT